MSFLVVAFASGASAQPISKFQILLNLDNNPSTGCDVPTLTGTFKGVERILRTTVDASMVKVVKIEVSNDCGSSWNDISLLVTPPGVPPGSHPVGMSNGTGGTSVIETMIPASLVPISVPPIVRIGVLAFANSEVVPRDEMLTTTQGNGNGPPILFRAALLSTIDVPTLSDLGLLLLGLTLALAAVALLRRRRSAAAVMIAILLLGLAGVAWAAAFDLDGNTTAEWTSAPLATEPTTDAPDGTDIRALYGERDAAGLHFRIDAKLLFNQPPVANDDTATVTEDAAATPINVLANDTDPESDPFTIASVTQPANGTVAITGGGTGLTYKPNANYCNQPPGTALDTFTYTLTPGSDSATVTVTVTCVDDNPVAVNDTATVAEDSGATAVNVLANDTDPDGGAKSITSVTQPANGTVAITGGGTGLTYQPNANYCNSPSGSPDTFTYTLTPGGSTATATVSMTVTCADDPPTAVGDAATVSEDSGANAINVLANDTDIDGGPKSVTSVTQPANGVVAITGGGTGVSYTPNANYCNQPPGTTLDTFTYTLTPGGTTATVTVTVTCADDAPVAVADAATVSEDSGANAINVLANDTDVDGGPISVASVTQPANGAVAITGGGTGVSYTPNADYCNQPPGTALDTFTYTLTPGSSSTTVTVTVTCVDDPPVAVADSATVVEDSG
ncbi:MAG: IPTL-CTERM sorting domain-containing protein, partial [Thermoanaerobaculia bacterium]